MYVRQRILYERLRYEDVCATYTRRTCITRVRKVGRSSVFSPLTILKLFPRGKRNDVGDVNTCKFTRRNRKFHRQVLTVGLPFRWNVRELSRTMDTGEKLPIIINITEVLLVP